MRFLILLYGDEAGEAALSGEERRKIVEQHVGFVRRARDRGVLVHSDALTGSSDAKTIRHGDGGKPLVTDGLFAETKEQLGGFYVLDCADLDEALQWASAVPASPGLVVEVRPVSEF